jgi:hypothetical protein
MQTGSSSFSRHIVPLSDRAAVILETARAAFPDSDLCFPNAKGVRFSDMAFTKALRDMGLGDRATAHGFRTSFKTWAAETGVRDEVSEAALAHTDRNSVRAAYRRTTFLDERRVVMQAWADFAEGASRIRRPRNQPRPEPLREQVQDGQEEHACQAVHSVRQANRAPAERAPHVPPL